MAWSSGPTTPPEQRHQALVTVGGDVPGADDQNEQDEGRGDSESHPPPVPPESALGHDQGNADQHRHGTERSQIVDGVERRVDLFGEHDDRYREAGGTYQRDGEELGPVGGCRRGVGEGGVEYSELLSLLPLLHVFLEMSFLVSLQQRLVELARAVVIARQFPELLLAPWHILDTPLIGGDPVSKPLLLALEDLEVRVHFTERLFQPEHVGRQRGPRGRRRLFLG